MIGHVDADCFYVSAERVRFPHLRGLPVGVLGNQGVFFYTSYLPSIYTYGAT